MYKQLPLGPSFFWGLYQVRKLVHGAMNSIVSGCVSTV